MFEVFLFIFIAHEIAIIYYLLNSYKNYLLVYFNSPFDPLKQHVLQPVFLKSHLVVRCPIRSLDDSKLCFLNVHHLLI